MIETINNPKTVKARKKHVCSLCGSHIVQGEKYVSAIYKSEGELYQWKEHLKCCELTKLFDSYYYHDDGITNNDFANEITELYISIWRDKYNENNRIVLPDFYTQIDFVYENKDYISKLKTS